MTMPDPTPTTPPAATAAPLAERLRMTPEAVLEEMDSVIRVSRAYQQDGESCAEIDPDMIQRWRDAQAAEIARLVEMTEAPDVASALVIVADALRERDALGYDAAMAQALRETATKERKRADAAEAQRGRLADAARRLIEANGGSRMFNGATAQAMRDLEAALSPLPAGDAP